MCTVVITSKDTLLVLHLFLAEALIYFISDYNGEQHWYKANICEILMAYTAVL